MPNGYPRITELDETTLGRLAAAMELRASDAQQQPMLQTYPAQIARQCTRAVVLLGAWLR